MLNEHWQDIIGYEGLYKISSIGNVYSIRNKKLLKQNTMNKEYHTVKLQNNGVKKYSSANECARVLNLSAGNINSVLRGERTHTHNIRFREVPKNELKSNY